MAGDIGGRANERGSEFRRGVGAYFLTNALCRAQPSGIELDPYEGPVSIGLEVDAPIDDIVVSTNTGRRLLIQATTKVSLSFRPPSKLKAFLEAARACSEASWANDRDIYLLISQDVPGSIRDLSMLLQRWRNNRLDDRVLESLGELQGLITGDETFRTALARVRIVDLPVLRSTDIASRHAQSLLERVVGDLQGPAAWGVLTQLVGTRASNSESIAVDDALRALTAANLNLRPEFQARLARTQRPAVALAAHRTRFAECAKQVDLRHIGVFARVPANFSGGQYQLRVSGPRVDTSPNPTTSAIRARALVVGSIVSPGEHEPVGPALLARKRTLIAGLPGAGKSTALLMFASDLSASTALPVPALIRVRDVVREGPRPDAFRQAISLASRDAVVSDDLEEALSVEAGHGGVYLLIDGLDEAREHLVAVLRWVESLANQAPTCPIVVTCRPSVLKAASSLGFEHTHLAPVRAVRAFLSNVMEVVSPDADQGALLDRLNGFLAKDPRLSETPLLPVLASIAVARSADRERPLHRLALLESSIESLVDGWELARSPMPGAARFGKSVMRRLAHDAFEVVGSASLRNRSLLEEVVEDLTSMGVDRYGLQDGIALALADEITDFWDSLGAFINDGRGTQVAARSELLREAAEALYVARLDESQISDLFNGGARPVTDDTMALAIARSPTLVTHLARAVSTGDLVAIDDVARAVTSDMKFDVGQSAELIDAAFRAFTIHPDEEVRWNAGLLLVELRAATVPGQASWLDDAPKAALGSWRTAALLALCLLKDPRPLTPESCDIVIGLFLLEVGAGESAADEQHP